MAYASSTDLVTVGFNQNVQGALTVTQVSAALQDASDFADTFFRARYGTNACPLLVWDSTVTKAVAKIAAYELLCIRGFNPNATADKNFRQQNDDAIAFLNRVQRQQAHPKVTPAGTNLPGSAQPIVISSSVVNLATGARGTNRGW